MTGIDPHALRAAIDAALEPFPAQPGERAAALFVVALDGMVEAMGADGLQLASQLYVHAAERRAQMLAAQLAAEMERKH